MFTVSEVQLVESLAPNLSVHCLILGETCSCITTVTSTTIVCVLILRNLDVLDLVVDLLLVDLLQGDILHDSGRLHFDFVDDVFDGGV